ncbi:eukaryotic peptide chain release factor GTP-binding subunit-like [Chenopodium quinoa]|uniref:eukaryotic peptide chain release factor GTP-binding subunit-like n=1 Tax=Chenopodium quinoa TaxID=63459 RepID=UPI000B77C27D|nr:eukaryotic peptide chain release factor GTP-binding subunit-like [Chenopodium quinoa]
MPMGCLFCDACGSYDHDSSNCPNECVDEFDNNESEHVNYVSNNNAQRFDNQRGQWNRNYQNQGNFYNYNQGGGYRNQGNQGSRGSYNNQGKGNFQNNAQRGPPPGFVPRTQGENSYSQPSSPRTNLEEIIENQTKLLNTYMAVSDKKFNEMMTHNKMLENQISQLANALKDHASPSSLPSQGLDPKKHVNAIVNRSGKVLEERLPRKGEDKEIPKKALVENEGVRASLDEVVVETPREVRVEKEIVKTKLPYP